MFINYGFIDDYSEYVINLKLDLEQGPHYESLKALLGDESSSKTFKLTKKCDKALF